MTDIRADLGGHLQRKPFSCDYETEMLAEKLANQNDALWMVSELKTEEYFLIVLRGRRKEAEAREKEETDQEWTHDRFPGRYVFTVLKQMNMATSSSHC